ncbi:MAG: signal peptide peptidase SppA [Haloferula sp.]
MIRSLLFAVFAGSALASEKPIVAVYDLERGLSENGANDGSMFGVNLESQRPLTFFDVTRSLSQAVKDPKVEAIVLDVDGAPLGLAQIEEIRRHLESAKEAEKDIWLYSDYYNTKTAILGSAANHFVLMPEAGVSFSGMAAQSMYFKGMLDKAGLQADVIHIGDFKSFGEEFYRTGPSEFAARQREELIDGMFGQVIETVAKGRGIESSDLLSLVDRGEFSADEAKASGLVDQLQYRTDFNAALKERYADAKIDREYRLPDLDGPEMDSIFDMFKLMMASGDDSKSKKDFIGVVVLDGGISDASVAPVRKQVVKLLKDEHAKGLVLRVNSPGGSALSSEVLWEVTDEWKASGRPFAVSMGGVAASGGYYVSAGADRIFAEAGTITGSIGVVGMKMVMGEALEKLGITTHTIQRGKHADAMSITRPFNEEEKTLVRNSMLEIYGTFKKRITDGRGNRLKGDLESMAGGRVYTGSRALELGLVDELGGLADAIAWTAEEAGVDGDSVKLRPEPKSALEGMFAGPEKKGEDEIVRMDAPAAASSAVRKMVRELGFSQLPENVRRQVGRALQRLDAISESGVQLIGPDLELRW